MIRLTPQQIRDRAEHLAARLGPHATVEPGESVIGGGSTPDLSLPTFLIVLAPPAPPAKAADLERKLRADNPPVIVRVERDRVLLDLRTVFPEQEDALAQAITRALAQL